MVRRCGVRWARPRKEEGPDMKLFHRSLTSLCLVLVAAGGCGKKSAEAEVSVKAEAEATTEATAGAEATLPDSETIIEEHEGGSVAWDIGADGQVKALVKGPENKPIRENVSAKLVWKAGAEPKEVPLNLDAKTGLFVAAGPK